MTTKVPRPILAAGLVAAILTLLLAGCTSNGTGRSSFAGGVDAFPGATTTVTDSSPPSATLGRSSVVLSANGLGPLMFGTQAARALAELTQALGQAEKPTLVPAGSSCGATRMFQWGNLHVLVNEVIAGAGATAGLVGWSLNGGVANPIDFRTDKGIGIGSTLQDCADGTHRRLQHHDSERTHRRYARWGRCCEHGPGPVGRNVLRGMTAP
jgi:hypothetical protein